MFNDIARENGLRDRLEELRMLSVSGDEMCVSGSFENKEVFWNPYTWPIFGGGKAKVAPDSQKDVTEETTSTVAEDPSVSNVQSREEAVKAREAAVKEREDTVERGNQQVTLGRMELNAEYERQNVQRKEIQEGNEDLYRRQRDYTVDSYNNLKVLFRFYIDTLRRILMEEKHERCALPSDLTDWFVHNWKGCRDHYQNQYRFLVKRDLEVPRSYTTPSFSGNGTEESNYLEIHIRPTAQRVVVFYTTAGLRQYMFDKNLLYDKALFELHKSTPYDDDHTNAPADTDAFEVDIGDVNHLSVS
jgi:hypothetical protein